MAKVQEVETGRGSFLEAAQKEMVAFERKEREFHKRSKREEAEELHLPVQLIGHH